MSEYMKPVPAPDHVTAEFWAAAKRRKLLIQRCEDCGARQSLPQACCRSCLSEKVTWSETSGRGTVYSYTTIHRPPSPRFATDVPYTLALVELEEGVRLLSNIIGIPPEDVRVAMPVEVVFDDISPTISLPRFRPRGQP
jgi:uncharacterized OB-fold protein